MYHLPLLPGYGPGVTVRSSATEQAEAKHTHKAMDAAEEAGYQGTYFAPANPEPAPPLDSDGFISSSPLTTQLRPSGSTQTMHTDGEAETTDVDRGMETGVETDTETMRRANTADVKRSFVEPPPVVRTNENVGEVVFFDYGVVVFFGFDSEQERSILDDIGIAGFVNRPLNEDDWEVEECHFEVPLEIPICLAAY
jgi:uncharacterized Rmd1/YagE family protein